MIEPMQAPQGARYEISVDGTVRTHRDTRETALEAANVLKACNRYSKVPEPDWAGLARGFRRSGDPEHGVPSPC
jgi:hypothetical protein